MRYITKLLFIIMFPIWATIAADLVEQDPAQVNLPVIHDINGEKFNFENIEDNVLVLHFWATWCSGCAKEMEGLNKLQKLLKKDRVIVVPISEDFKGENVVREFYKAYNLKNLTAFVDKKQRLFHQMNVISLPTTFVLDSTGQVVAYANGPVDWLEDKNINLLKKYVKQKDMYNKDYIKLINKQKMFEKTTNEVQNKRNIKELIPENAETKLEFSSSDKKRGEIRVVNSEGKEASLKIRRPVNKIKVNENEKN
ncbi:MAG: TlpA family protein disulfide reductase [Alphaproteobacteria bacterium]|nr:TlpA family protein disulfide reductase [Alphaproteobacteria bacterium]